MLGPEHDHPAQTAQPRLRTNPAEGGAEASRAGVRARGYEPRGEPEKYPSL